MLVWGFDDLDLNLFCVVFPLLLCHFEFMLVLVWCWFGVIFRLMCYVHGLMMLLWGHLTVISMLCSYDLDVMTMLIYCWFVVMLMLWWYCFHDIFHAFYAMLMLWWCYVEFSDVIIAFNIILGYMVYALCAFQSINLVQSSTESRIKWPNLVQETLI